MTALVAVFAGSLGAPVGSFLNVVVYRVPRGLSILHPPSSCPVCQTPIRFRDNVPIVSYLVLRGRCRVCRTRISPRYPFVEAATTAIWVGSALRYGSTEKAGFVALGASILLALALIDLEHRRLPNVLVLPSVACAAAWLVAVGAIERSWRMVVVAGVCGAAAFALFLLVALVSGGMGMGDVKLAAFVGLYAGRFGAGVVIAAVLISFIAGGMVAVALLLSRKRGRKDTLPFGPALAFGALAATFLGPTAVDGWLGF